MPVYENTENRLTSCYTYSRNKALARLFKRKSAKRNVEFSVNEIHGEVVNGDWAIYLDYLEKRQ